MLKAIRMASLLGAGLALSAGYAQAVQVVVTGINRNADGTSTYHFAVRLNRDETLQPQADFVTVYNFAGLVGTPKTPAGWAFSSEDFGKTPTWQGYPAVLPVDIPGLSNVTWTAMQPIAGGTEIRGFEATTRIPATTEGEYTGQSTIEEPAIGNAGARATKQAVIGQLPTPAFLPR